MKIRQKEQGITLVALIITIIILIILAAVTIYAVTKNNFVGLATAGTQNYAEAQVDESTKMDDLVGKLTDTVSNIASMQAQNGGTGGGGTGSGGGDTPTTPEEPVELPAAGTEVPAEGWSVEVAKGLVARDGLAAHIGEIVDYNPPAGGTWRIFYYDNEDQGNGKGYFGDPLGTVYLKRDKELIDLNFEDYDNYIPKDNYAVYDRINPMLIKELGRDTSLTGTHHAAWLADSGNWSQYEDKAVARWTIASPSYEMFFRAVSETSETYLGINICDKGYVCSTASDQDSSYNAFPCGRGDIFDPGKTTIEHSTRRNVVSLCSPLSTQYGVVGVRRRRKEMPDIVLGLIPSYGQFVL